MKGKRDIGFFNNTDSLITLASVFPAGPHGAAGDGEHCQLVTVSMTSDRWLTSPNFWLVVLESALKYDSGGGVGADEWSKLVAQLIGGKNVMGFVEDVLEY